MTPTKLTTLLLAAAISNANAQGDLKPPPGAPAPSMKTLDQVEPRTDLATVAGSTFYMHHINEPGSYYLSENLDVTTTHGIRIAASGVTLDLNGFTIVRSADGAASGTAILLSRGGESNIRIKNGQITSGVSYDSEVEKDQFTGSGFQHGIRTRSLDPENVRVSHIHVNGCEWHGIDLGPRTSNTVEHCAVRVAGGFGIRAGEVHHSTAIDCGSDAIQAAGNVSHSRGESVGTTSNGIQAVGNVANSYGRATGTGVSADGILIAGNASDSYGFSAGGKGIHTNGNVSNCSGVSTGTGTGADGIRAGFNVSNSYGQSLADYGIQTAGNVSSSYGQSSGRGGILASGNVSNSYGQSSGNSGIEAGRNISNSFGKTSAGTGLYAGGSAFNSVGWSTGFGEGIRATHNVSNSSGASSKGNGIEATTVSHSSGISNTDPASIGVGLRCRIAIGCTSEGGEDIDHKYNMP